MVVFPCDFIEIAVSFAQLGLHVLQKLFEGANFVFVGLEDVFQVAELLDCTHGFLFTGLI